MFGPFPGALHGIEAFLLAHSSLLKLRTAIFHAVWSRGQRLANACAVLSLVEGPQRCDPVTAWFNFGFACWGCIWLIALRRLLGFIVCWTWLSFWMEATCVA